MAMLEASVVVELEAVAVVPRLPTVRVGMVEPRRLPPMVYQCYRHRMEQEAADVLEQEHLPLRGQMEVMEVLATVWFSG
jgi:hypothetical protein